MIEQNYNEKLLKKDSAAQNLVEILNQIDSELNFKSSSLYYKFPFYRDYGGNNSIAQILFITEEYGVFIFKCLSDLENINLVKLDDEISTIDSMIFSKLIKNKELQKNRRNLKFQINSLIYIQDFDLPDIKSDFEVVNSNQKIKELILESKSDLIIEFAQLAATIEGSIALTQRKEELIEVAQKQTKGSILRKIESSLKVFDREQKQAALNTLDGAQRIRGLAGTGKTVILSMKAALIHLQDPNAEILYTYYTKALGETVRKFITRFYRNFSENDPDWDKIHVMHGWGGASLRGVYYKTSINNNIPPKTFPEAKVKNPSDPFDYICKELITYNLKKEYDYSLIDEGQDFPINFYKLCRKITKNNRIVWAYDDFQNILNVSIQSEKETFGKNEKGQFVIDFSLEPDKLKDIILYKCYRNPRKILVSAFALGLGIYNSNKKIVQRLESNTHWESLGFHVENGNSHEGDIMTIIRTTESSPLILTELLEDDIISIESFSNVTEECNSVVKNIKSDIENEIPPEQICVICLDDRNSKKYFSKIETSLFYEDIKSFNIQNAPSNNTTFNLKDHITLSTIYKAKGNEVGSVYIIGVDSVFVNPNNVISRNKLFTAITRSKGWVTLSGISPRIDLCRAELQALVENDFKLIFKQPSEKEVRTIRQEISAQQNKLNQIEKIARDLKKLGLTEDDLKTQVLDKIINSKL